MLLLLYVEVAFKLAIVLLTNMTNSQSRSTESLEEVVADDTPLAEAFWEFRKKVYQSQIGPGAVPDLAEKLDVPESTLSRLVAPSSIRIVAEVERHVGE